MFLVYNIIRMKLKIFIRALILYFPFLIKNISYYNNFNNESDKKLCLYIITDKKIEP